MNGFNFDSANHEKWSQLLQQAVNEPGLMLKAYSAFHGYGLGNQLAALLQCHFRGIETGPINTSSSEAPTWGEVHLQRPAPFA
jgi:hypothetical protein